MPVWGGDFTWGRWPYSENKILFGEGQNQSVTAVVVYALRTHVTDCLTGAEAPLCHLPPRRLADGFSVLSEGVNSGQKFPSPPAHVLSAGSDTGLRSVTA